MSDRSLLIHGGTVLTMDGGMRVLSPGYVLTQGARIAQVESGDPPPDLLRSVDGRLDASRQAVLPGLINAHTHLYQSFLKGLDDGLGLVDWCANLLFAPADVIHTMHWEENDERAGYYYSLLGAIEMIRGGITCCVDMDIVMDSIFEAWQRIGLRGVGALTLADQWLPARLRRDEELLRRETVERVRRWHKGRTRPEGRARPEGRTRPRMPADEPLTTTVLAPSTPFLASRALLEWTREQAEALDVGIQIHVAETEYEVEKVLAETGMRPLEYLDSLDFLNERVSAVHCVHVTEEEIETLHRRGVTVVHSPKSNLKLGSGIAPVRGMLAAGVPMALGTDGAASNDLLDMFEEMRFAALLPRGVARDPQAMSAADVLRMATVHGARTCGIEAGALVPGRLADVITVTMDRPHMLPNHDPVCTLVYCARADDVQNVIINGHMVMRKRRILTVVEEDVVAEAVSLGERIVQRSLGSELYRP